MSPNEFSAIEAAKLIATGALSSEELVRSCLKRVEAREPVVHAWSYLRPELAIAEARARDSERADKGLRGPLHGVPFGVKDVIDTADMPTEMGSPIYRDYRPRADAACVAALRAAGAIVLGKTVTAEFAYIAPGPTTNPISPGHTPGGSSSGSAAAVADGMVPFALGTQTGGSIIRPASFCGVFGFKPSYGAVSRSGLKLAAESLDTIGVLARDLDDVALVTSILRGSQPEAFHAQRLAPPKLGLCRTTSWAQASADSRAAVEGVAATLAECGAEIVEVSLPDVFDELASVRSTINDFERARAGTWEWNNHRNLLSTESAACIARGMTIPYAVYRKALGTQERLRAAFEGLAAELDAVLALATNDEAPLGLASTGDSTFQSLWTLVHAPAVTLPAGAGRNGLPIGVQLVSGYSRDDQLLRVAAWAWEAIQNVNEPVRKVMTRGHSIR